MVENLDSQISFDMESGQANVIWVPIKQVIPNPLNPRKDNSVRSVEMQEIIRKRGWEEPLTVYKKNKVYVLLAGHRRLFAARAAKVDIVPCFVVDKPSNEQEEIERIASLQSGRVDWSPWEWANFTYNRWIAWKRPGVTRFAKEINLGVGAVKQYITVLDYFPRVEIEQPIQSKDVTISSLEALVRWIKALKQHKEDLVESMGEDLIRKIMIEKIKSRKLNRDELRNVDYCKLAKEDDVRDFLVNPDAELNTELGYLGLKKKYQDFNGHLISIGLMEKRLQERFPEIKPETEHQREQAIKALNELKALIEQKMSEIDK